MKTRSIILLLLLLACTGFGDAIFLAINDFEGKGITQEESEVITEKIRTIMTKSKFFKVMSRSEMAAIMMEQEFQQTGMCNDASCIAELGQIVGVDKIVAGTIGKVGTLFSVTMKMVDVSTSEIIYSVSHEKKCSIEELLAVESKVLVSKMETEVSHGTKARLWVTTEPTNIKVVINDTIHENSPLKISMLEPGQHYLRIQKKTYDDINDTFTIDAGEILKKNYTLIHTLAYKHEQRKGSIKRVVLGRLFSGLLTAGLGATGVIFNNLAESDIQEKDSLYNEYKNSKDPDKDYAAMRKTMEDKQSDIDRNVLIRNISYGSAIASTTIFVVSIPMMRRNR